MVKIGAFLAQLRKEQGLTQEQLGQRLGVTNKTVSRWETGTYLPPVEMLQVLSELYEVTINEILSAQRLSQVEYVEKAEENIRTALDKSAFSLKEKQDYFNKKWYREHRWALVMDSLAIGLLMVLGIWRQELTLVIIGNVWCSLRAIYWTNQRKGYVEAHAFDGSGA